MTSNSAPSGVASACAEDGGGAFQAMDKNGATYWYHNVIDTLPHWLKYDFGAGNAKTITQYTITPAAFPNYDPRDWTFDGSNDDAAWTTLDTHTDYTFPALTKQTFNAFVNTTAYRYYRLYVTDVNRDLYKTIILVEWEMMETVLEATTNYLKKYRRLSFQ